MATSISLGAFNRFLTICIIFIYNIYLHGRLFKIRTEVRKANQIGSNFDMSDLRRYLQKWSYPSDIKEAPISNKAIIRERTRDIHPKAVYKNFYTGGSTGEPLKLPYSKTRAILRTASILYYNHAAGYNLGDRYLFVRSKPKSKLFQLLRNEILFVPNDFSSKRIEDLAYILLSKRIRIIIGYPSVAYELAAYFNTKPELKSKLCVRSFISGAEPLEEERAAFIRSCLGCNIIDRYSNEENGVIAQQREYAGDYIVDRFNLYVEVLNPDTLQPVAEGETGIVVVTDIYSDLIPMIRYDTGDLATVSKYVNGQLWSIRKIMGRIVDQFYTTRGTPFSPLILGPYIRLPLTDLSLQIQFQFSQLSIDHFSLILKAEESQVPKLAINKVMDGLKTVLGDDAIIDLAFVKDIPALLSGKRPLYSNKMSS